MKLEELREKVDLLDAEMLKLLNARMELALRTRKLKDGVVDAAREKEVMERVKKASVGLVSPEFTEKLFREIIAEARKQQEKNPLLIGFQGEHGAYGEIAAKGIFACGSADFLQGVRGCFLCRGKGAAGLRHSASGKFA